MYIVHSYFTALQKALPSIEGTRRYYLLATISHPPRRKKERKRERNPIRLNGIINEKERGWIDFYYKSNSSGYSIAWIFSTARHG
jgi:hypothetical protein